MSPIAYRLVIFFASLLGVALSISAQQIQGQVRYAESSQAAFNIPVHCDGTGGNSQQMTDRNGKFYFRVSPGHYSVYIHLPGYQDEQQSFDLTDTTSSEYATFRLKGDRTSSATSNSANINASASSPAREEFDKGIAANTAGKQDEGIAHLQRAVSLDPKFVEAQLMLGTIYMDLQQWDKAEQALRKTLEIDPKAANAFFALGEVYLHQKKYDEAEKALQDGLAIEERSAPGHLALARLYWEKVTGVKEEAQWRPSLEKSYKEVNQALQLDANLAEAHLLKGNLYFKVRRAADALNEFDEYLRLDPNGQFAPQTRTLADKIRKALAQEKKP